MNAMPKRGVPTKPERGRSLCKRTGKRRYRSVGAALRAAEDLAEQYAGSEFRTYPCLFCRGVHLTTQPDRKLRLVWTGPRESDLGDVGLCVLREPVPPQRWPYGLPEQHEECCRLHAGGLFCDCLASDESDHSHGEHT